MTLDEITNEVVSLVQGSAVQLLKAGKRLCGIRDQKLYQAKYKTLNAYLAGDTKPRGIGPRYAYVLMGVADAFEEKHAAANPIDVLNLLVKIAREVFPDKKPVELMTGRHQFTGASGEVRVLDFEKDHSAEGLQEFLAAHRLQPKKDGASASPDGAKLAQALEAEETAEPGFKGTLKNGTDGAFMLTMSGTFDVLRKALRDLTTKLL